MSTDGAGEDGRKEQFRHRVLKGRGTNNDHCSWLRKAADGDVAMAWAVVSVLADVLSDLSQTSTLNEGELLRGAEFFDELWGIKNERAPNTASGLELVEGLKVLFPHSGPKTKARDAQAWADIETLKGILESASHCPVLCRYAAAFFDKLLSIRVESATGKPTKKALVGAFACLHLLVPRHRPAEAGKELEIAAYLAAEQVERKKSGSKRGSADKAREAVAAKGKSATTPRNYRTNNPDMVCILSELTDVELEALASTLDDKEGRATLRQ